VSLTAGDFGGPADFVRIFGRTGEMHVEIGCGKGTFLLAEAAARPRVNFLGIERSHHYWRYAVDRAGRRGFSNVRILLAEAADFLAGPVAASSVDCFHVYFPDPWPKRRHNKRRFFSRRNLENMLRALKEGGLVKVVTDHADYFEIIKALIDESAGSLERIGFEPAAGAAEGEYVGTNYERKYLAEGRKIYAVAAVAYGHSRCSSH